MKTVLHNYFNRYIEFNQEEIDEIYSLMSLKEFKKKEYLLEDGQICQHKFFILEGLVRSFYLDHKGEDKIVQFAIENWWVSNMESFSRKTPSELSIQALEKTSVLTLSSDNLEKLYIAIPKLERLFRIITENMLIAIQKRNSFYMKKSSKEKYDLVVNSIPDLIQRVPQYMIASYLEMSPEHLSTLRKST